jgi:hypothetical protein
LVAA